MLLINGTNDAHAYYDSSSEIQLDVTSQTSNGKYSPWLLVGYDTMYFSSVKSTHEQCQLQTTNKPLESTCVLYFKNSNGDSATLTLEQNPHPQSHISGNGSSNMFSVQSIKVTDLTAQVSFKSLYNGQPIMWKYFSSSPSVEYSVTPTTGTTDTCNIETLSTILSDTIGSLTFIQKQTLKRLTLTVSYTEEDGQIIMSVS